MSVADDTSPPACTATTRYGNPCTRTARPGKTVCHSHDPDEAETRKQNSRAGGLAAKSPATQEIADVKAALWQLIADVKSGETPPQIGATVVQAANTILRAVDYERKLRVEDEVEERLRVLEERALERIAS